MAGLVPATHAFGAPAKLAVLGDDGGYEIHHGADRRRLAQIPMDDEPDVAPKGRDALIDADEVRLPLAEEARQAGDTDACACRDQVLADIVHLAGDGAFARNAE